MFKYDRLNTGNLCSFYSQSDFRLPFVQSLTDLRFVWWKRLLEVHHSYPSPQNANRLKIKQMGILFKKSENGSTLTLVLWRSIFLWLVLWRLDELTFGVNWSYPNLSLSDVSQPNLRIPKHALLGDARSQEKTMQLPKLSDRISWNVINNLLGTRSVSSCSCDSEQELVVKNVGGMTCHALRDELMLSVGQAGWGPMSRLADQEVKTNTCWGRVGTSRWYGGVSRLAVGCVWGPICQRFSARTFSEYDPILIKRCFCARSHNKCKDWQGDMRWTRPYGWGRRWRIVAFVRRLQHDIKHSALFFKGKKNAFQMKSRSDM